MITMSPTLRVDTGILSGFIKKWKFCTFYIEDHVITRVSFYIHDADGEPQACINEDGDGWIDVYREEVE